MMRLRTLLAIAGFLSAAAAHAQLISERVEGVARLCRYAPTGIEPRSEVLTGIDTNPSGTEPELERRLRQDAERSLSSRDSGEREIEIDASRPCPSTFPDYREPRTLVPSYATLESQSRVNGELFCSYRYMGRRYVISLGRRSICPYTPVGLSY